MAGPGRAGGPKQPTVSYTRGAKITVEEDRSHEFKSLANATNRANSVANYCRKYIVAFLNAAGGVLYCGVEDNGVVLGLPLTRAERDDIRLAVDRTIKSFVPQVDNYLYSVAFVPVIQGKTRQLPGPVLSPVNKIARKNRRLSRDYRDLSEDDLMDVYKRGKGRKKDRRRNTQFFDKEWERANRKRTTTEPQMSELYVIEVEVEKGRAPVYFTRDGIAYIRRDGSVEQMNRSTVATRISDSWKTTPSTIRTIPDYTIDFAGREGDLHIIAEFVYTSKDSCKIVCLHGRPGCGKSQFAYRVASEFKDLFPNEEFVCDLRTPKGGTLEPRDVMAILIRSVWPDKRLSNLTDAAIKSIYISCFRQKRTILIIENASDYSSVEELIPSGVDCLCIITSRKNLGLDIQVRYPTALNMVVSDLTPTEGLELLRKFVPDIDSDVGLGLCQQSGFLPLGIRVIGGLLNHRPNLTPAMLLAKYRTSPNKRAALADRLGLREMLDLVPKDDMVALRQLSVFAGPFDGMAASCILGLDYEDAEDTLGNLLEQSLIDYDAHSLRYSQNDFLRQIVTDLYMSSDETKGEFEKISTTDDDRQASSIGQSELEVQKRFVRYYCKVIHSVQSLPTADAATDRIQSDRLNLEAAFRLAVKGGDAFRAEARDLAQGLYLYRFTLDPNTKKEVASYATNHHSMNDINYDSLSAAVQKNIPDPTLNDKMNDLAVNDSTHDPEQNVTQNATSPSTTDTAAPDATCEVGTKAMDDPSNKS